MDGVGASATSAGAGPLPHRTPPVQGKGFSPNDKTSSRAAGSVPIGASMKYPFETFGRSPAQADARAASFVRLNNFLLRTHVTSLVSALSEDGWLEIWEKERLCCQAREDSLSWMQAFFRSYTRLIETEDVKTFVAGLRSEIPRIDRKPMIYLHNSRTAPFKVSDNYQIQ